MNKSIKKQLALFKQTMICDNRDLSFTGLKSVTVMAFFLGFIGLNTGFRTAAGLQALEILYAVNLVLLPVVCVALFLPVIIEERKNQSMGLLMMTGLDAFGYLAGKCGSRYVQLLMLIALQIPFAIVSVALGGITVEMVLLVYFYMLAYSFCLTCIFIMCSLIFSDFFKGLLFGSAICFFIVVFNYSVVGDTQGHYGLDHYVEEALEALFEVGMDNVTRTWGTAGLESFNVYITCFCCFGVTFLLITLKNFHSKSMEINSYDLTKKTQQIAGSILPAKMIKRERFKTNNPIFTKDYYYIMHGRFLSILQPLITFAVMGYVYLDTANYYSYYRKIQYAAGAGLAISYFSVLIITWYAANRLWYEEIEAMTFNSLKMTPRPVNQLFNQKLKVVFRCVLPSVITFFCITLLLISEESGLDSDIFIICFFFTTAIPAAFYLTLYLSLFLKKMRYIISVVTCLLIFFIEVFIIDQSFGDEKGLIAALGILQGVMALILHFASQNTIKDRYLE